MEGAAPPPARAHLCTWFAPTQIWSDLILDMHCCDGASSLLLTRSALTGAPAPGVSLRTPFAHCEELLTDAAGECRLKLPSKPPGVDRPVSWLSHAESGTLQPLGQRAFDASSACFSRHRADQKFEWSVFDDRGLYKCGEPLRLKGFCRAVHARKRLLLPGADPFSKHMSPESPLVTEWSVRWSLRCMRVEVASGTVHLSPNGAFALSLTLPEKEQVTLVDCRLIVLSAFTRRIEGNAD